MATTFNKYGENNFSNNNGRRVSISADFDKKDNLIYRVYKFDAVWPCENRLSFCKSEKSAKQMAERFLGVKLF